MSYGGESTFCGITIFEEYELSGPSHIPSILCNMSPSCPTWPTRGALLCVCMFSASGRIHRQSRPAWARWRPSEAVQTTATSVWILLFNRGQAAKRREPEEQAQKWAGQGPVGGAPGRGGARWAWPRASSGESLLPSRAALTSRSVCTWLSFSRPCVSLDRCNFR